MESTVPGRARGQPAWKWTQDTKDTLAKTLDEAKEMAKNREYFQWTVMWAMFCQGHAT